MISRLFPSCFLIPVLLLPGLSLQANDSPPAQARQIEEQLLSPCCWRESVAVHRSPEAQQLRAEIARLAASGQTSQQIIEHFVSLYGERILREPRGPAFRWLVATPVVALALGLGALVWYISLLRRPSLAAGGYR